MPRRKKTDAVVEAKTEQAAEAVAKSAVEAAVDKPVEKKAPAKKAAAKTKTATRAAASPKETVKVQYGGDEYDFAEIKKAVEADYKGKISGKVKNVEIYIKPEDKAVYYVINSDFSDKVSL